MEDIKIVIMGDDKTIVAGIVAQLKREKEITLKICMDLAHRDIEAQTGRDSAPALEKMQPKNSALLDEGISLTNMERKVLKLISEDMTRKEIAARLYVSEKTVTNHISSILDKLHVRSRVGAIMKGVELGILK